MRVGAILPQGWLGEFADTGPEQAWEQIKIIAQRADELGFDSIWLFDHPQPGLDSPDAPTFEALSSLSALAALTHRIRIGQLVLSAGYRSAAMTAKTVSTMDVISGGRMELGIGCGWREDEWRAYGLGFPPLRVRLQRLEESLAVIAGLLEGGPVNFKGRHMVLDGAVNVPAGLQKPRIPLVVGGNGRKVTWRLAAAYADELNLDGLTPAEVEAAIPLIREHCEAVGRDPTSLGVSVHIWPWRIGEPGMKRQELLQDYARTQVTRVMVLDRACLTDVSALDALRADALAAGAAFDERAASTQVLRR